MENISIELNGHGSTTAIFAREPISQKLAHEAIIADLDNVIKAETPTDCKNTDIDCNLGTMPHYWALNNIKTPTKYIPVEKEINHKKHEASCAKNRKARKKRKKHKRK